MTYFLYLELINKIKNKVFCNYKLNFNFKWLNAFDMIDVIKELNDSVVGIDELHEYCDSRSSGSLQNRYISGYFLQSRHSNANIYYTTQFIDQVDLRIRRITDVDILCENLHIDSDNDNDEDLFKFTIMDLRYRTRTTKILYAKPIFDMFDSTERINPFLLTKEKEKEIKIRLSKQYEKQFKK